MANSRDEGAVIELVSEDECDREHIKALIEEGYTDADIAEVMEHSIEWVRRNKS